jgi:hypothetical protein
MPVLPLLERQRRLEPMSVFNPDDPAQPALTLVHGVRDRAGCRSQATFLARVPRAVSAGVVAWLATI